MKKTISVYLVWRLLIIFFVVLSIKLLPLQTNHLGGGLQNYLEKPLFWWHGNFDGEHYLSIAQHGYKPLQYFFFPVFPNLIRSLNIFFLNTLFNLQFTGILLTSIFSFLSILYLIKLLKLDFKNINRNVFLVIFLIFPTSFYLIAVYTESLFLFLAVFAFYSARSKNWIAASIATAIASATRVVGVSLIAALLVEYVVQNKLHKKIIIRKYLYLIFLGFIMSLGLLGYMYFLYQRTGDSLVFIHEVEVYGDQRSSSFVLLPQVFYRYFAKILPNLDFYWPSMFTTFLELTTAIVFLVVIILSFFKLRLSYWTYLTLGYLTPTLSGSFSSLPRYVIVLFPGFILFTQYTQRLPGLVQTTIAAILLLSLTLATGMYARGYWIS